MTTLAQRLYDGEGAQHELEGLLDDAGVQYETIGWDHYDNSIELYGVPPDYRLDEPAQRIIHGAGFSTAYVNHTDKWETHYRFDPSKPFMASKGWRGASAAMTKESS